MASPSIAAQTAFTDFKPFKAASISVDVRDDLTMATLAAAKGKAGELRAVIQSAYGAALPETPSSVQGNDVSLLWYGPDQWMIVAPRGSSGRDIEVELKSLVGGLASVVDQSDGRAVLCVSGPKARDVLAKGVPIDLDPSVFTANSVAITHASHIGILLWQVDTAPTYNIAMFRSYADSFLHWLEASAEEFRSDASTGAGR